MLHIYPVDDATVWMNPKIVVEKFGERSWGFCNEVTDIALLEPSASVINVTHTYGLLPAKVKPTK